MFEKYILVMRETYMKMVTTNITFLAWNDQQGWNAVKRKKQKKQKKFVVCVHIMCKRWL